MKVSRTEIASNMSASKTTKRRNLALKRRRELINAGAITQGHVAYPARLMGKGKDDVRYREIENFSNVDVRESK